MRVEPGAYTVNTEVNDIERRLAQLGYRMESSLAALDGEGHALIEIASGDLTNAIRPSRGGRLIVTPESISRRHVA